MLARLKVVYQGARVVAPEAQRLFAARFSQPLSDTTSQRPFSSAAADAPASRVKELKTDQEYNSVLQDAAKTGALSVFDYTAAWCGPCRMIAPVVDQLSHDFADENVTFYKVDIDRDTIQESVREAAVASVPTFKFFRGGKLIAAFSGADKRQLENNVLNLVSLGA